MADEGTLNRFVIGVQVKDDGSLNKLLNTLSKIEQAQKNLGKTTKDSGNKHEDAGSKVKKLGGVFEDAEKKVNNFNKTLISGFRAQKNEISDVLRRVALWGSGIAVIFGTVKKFKEVYRTVIDLELQMAELHKVMGDYKPYAKLKQNLFNIAKNYSASIKDVAEVAKIWAQQGKTMEEVQKLTALALRGMNAANLTAAQSVEFLTSVTQSYNMEAEKTYSILDGIMRVQANYAITAQNLAKGFMIAGKASALLGDDLGSLMAAITVIGEKTRETGNVIGNSLKTIIARLARPETLRMLESFGVKVWTREGNVANFRTIMKQLNQMIQSGQLSPFQQQQIAMQIGGIRKYKDVIIAMQDWHKAEKVRLEFLDAYNDAAKASAIIQDTLTKKFEKFNAALTELGDTVLGQTVLPSLHLVMDVATGAAEKLNELAQGDFSKIFLDMGALMPFTMIGMGLGRKIGQGKITDLMRQLEMVVGLRSTGLLPQNFASPLEKAFGFVQQKGKQAVVAHEKVYDELLNNLNIIQKQASRFGLDASLIYRTYLAEAIANARAQAGKSAGFFSMLLTGMKYGGTSKIKGTEKGTAGLTAFTIGSSIRTFASSILKFSAITLALEGFFWGIKKLFFTEKPKHEIVNRGVDFSSDLTKEFISIAESLTEIKQKAKEANISTKEYIKSLDQEKVIKDLLTDIVEPISVMLKTNKINSLEQLRDEMQKLGIDVKNTTEALHLQRLMYKFVDHEMLKSKDILKDFLYKQKDVFIKKFNNYISNITFNPSKINLKQNEINESARSFFESLVFGLKVAAKQADYAKIFTFDDRTRQMTEKVIKYQNLREKLEEQYGQEMVNFLEKNLNNVKDLWDLIDKANTEGSAKVRRVFKDFLVKNFAGYLLGKSREVTPRLDISEIKRENYKTEEEYRQALLESIYDEAVTGVVENLIGTTDEFKKFKDIMKSLSKNLDNEAYALRLASVAFVKAMLTAKDKIFDALLKFSVDIEKLRISKNLSGLLGKSSTYNIDLLNKFRDFVTNLASIPIELEANMLDAKFYFEKLTNVLNTKSNVLMNQDLVKQIMNFKDKALQSKDMTQTTTDAKTLLQILEAAKEQSDKSGEKGRTLQEIIDIVSKLVQVYATYTTTFEEITRRYESFVALFKKIGIELPELSDLEKKDVKSLENLEQKLKPAFGRLIKKATEDLLKAAYNEYKVQLVQASNDIKAAASEIFITGNDIVDIQAKGMQNVANIIADYNAQIQKLRDDFYSGAVSMTEEQLIVETKKLELEKSLAIKTAEANMQLEIFQYQMDKIKNALDAFRSSTVDFLSDINTYKFDTSEGFDSTLRNFLGSWGQTFMQNTFSGMWDIIVGKSGMKIAAALLGEKLPDQKEVAPEIQAMEKVTDSNLKLVNVNTMLANTIRELPRYIYPQTPFYQQGKILPGKFAFKTKVITDAEKIDFSGMDNLYREGLIEATAKVRPYSATKITDLKNKQKNIEQQIYSDWYYFARGMGTISGSILGNFVASKNKRSNELVGFGNMLGGLLGGLTGNPLLGFLGSSIGGLLGGLFGKKDKSDDIKKKLEELNDDTKKVVENTAPLKEIDEKIINAPANFVLPTLARSGGNVQHIGSITIQVNGASDPQATAQAIQGLFDGHFGFNNVNSNI